MSSHSSHFSNIQSKPHEFGMQIKSLCSYGYHVLPANHWHCYKALKRSIFMSFYSLKFYFKKFKILRNLNLVSNN